jgi:tripartite ATP-independent transporter DctP family solute receptor
MKKFMTMLIAILLVVSLTACGNQPSNNEAPAANSGTGTDPQVKLIFSNITTDAGEEAGDLFCELVNEYSNGTITVEHFPDNVLGDDKTVIEQTQIGDIDIAVSSTSPLVNVYPDYYLFDAPYLFLGVEEARAALASEEGTAIRDGIKDAGTGLIGLAWWENGFRNITNNKTPIRVPEDIKGMKIRTMENDVHLAAFKAFKANPTPMAFSELFTAMQQGTVDGQENPLAIIVGNKFYEVQKYISKTEHIYVPFCVVMNENKFNSLTANQQEAITKAMAEATEFQLKRNSELDIEAVKVVTDNGAEIVELTPAEKAEWQNVMKEANIFEMVKDKMTHPEYLEAMLEAQK